MIDLRLVVECVQKIKSAPTLEEAAQVIVTILGDRNAALADKDLFEKRWNDTVEEKGVLVLQIERLTSADAASNNRINDMHVKLGESNRLNCDLRSAIDFAIVDLTAAMESGVASDLVALTVRMLKAVIKRKDGKRHDCRFNGLIVDGFCSECGMRE